MALQGTGSAVNGWTKPFYLTGNNYPITLAAWVKTPASSTTSTGMFGLAGSNAMAYMIFYGSDIGGGQAFQLELYDDTALSAGGSFSPPKSQFPITSDGNWHHIAAQIYTNNTPPAGQSGGWFWFDGVRTSATTAGFNLGAQTFNTLQIGVAPSDGTEPVFSTTTNLAELCVFEYGPNTELMDPIIARIAAGANPLRVAGRDRLKAYHPLRNNFQDFGSRHIGFAPLGTPVAPVWVGHPPGIDPPPTLFGARRFVTHVSAALVGTTTSANSGVGTLSTAIGLTATGSSADSATGSLMASSLQGYTQVSTNSGIGFLISETHIEGTGQSSNAGLGSFSTTQIPLLGLASSTNQGVGSLTIPSIAANAQQLQNALVDSIMRGQPFLPPATWYVGLVTQFGDTITPGVEVSGGSYARAAVAASLTAWSATNGPGTTIASSGTSGMVSNNAAIAFPTASADWGTIVGYEFWDLPSGGNRWFSGKLGTAVTILNGQTRQFLAASLSIAIG